MSDARIEALDGADDLAGVMDVDRLSFATPWTSRMYQAELQNPDTSFVVVLRIPECRVAGYCSYRAVLDEIHINNVAVRPEYRRRGFGKQLVEHVLGSGRRKLAVRALLEVRASNVAARQLYEDLGFAVIGLRRNYYSNPVEDALVLSVNIQILELDPNA